MAAAAVMPKLFFNHMRGRAEGIRDIAVADLEQRGLVVRLRQMGQRRAGCDRGAAIGGGRQNLVVDLDRSGGILGDVARVRYWRCLACNSMDCSRSLSE